MAIITLQTEVNSITHFFIVETRKYFKKLSLLFEKETSKIWM